MKLLGLVCIALALALHTTVCVAVPKQTNKDCILQPDGSLSCTMSAVLDVSVRRGQPKEKSPCARTNVPCWCKLVKDYTNDVRRKNGVKGMLKLGPRKQLDQANRYAQKLSKMGRLKHQSLPKASKEVGCKRWVGGENLAYNYENGNVAKACVDQWIKSKPHFRNLVMPWFTEVVAGFHFDNDGRVYCVQTFSLIYPKGTYGSLNGERCGRVA